MLGSAKRALTQYYVTILVQWMGEERGKTVGERSETVACPDGRWRNTRQRAIQRLLVTSCLAKRMQVRAAQRCAFCGDSAVHDLEFGLWKIGDLEIARNATASAAFAFASQRLCSTCSAIIRILKAHIIQAVSYYRQPSIGTA